MEVVPAPRPRDENQVPRRRDRQQLGCSLDDAEDECLPESDSFPGALPYPQRRQHDGEKKRRAGNRDGDLPAAHAREYGECVSVGVR